MASLLVLMTSQKRLALMRNDYPVLSGQPTLMVLWNFCNRLSLLRGTEDLPDYTNQKNIYVSGRSTTRVPTGHADVLATDRQGDVVYAVDASYVYMLVSKSGTLTWGRIAIDSTW